MPPPAASLSVIAFVHWIDGNGLPSSDEEGTARSAGVVLIKRLTFLNQPPRRHIS